MEAVFGVVLFRNIFRSECMLDLVVSKLYVNCLLDHSVVSELA